MKYTCTTHLHSYGYGHRPTLGERPIKSGRWETDLHHVMFWTLVRKWHLPRVALFSYNNTASHRVTSRSFLTVEDGQ